MIRIRQPPCALRGCSRSSCPPAARRWPTLREEPMIRLAAHRIGVLCVIGVAALSVQAAAQALEKPFARGDTKIGKTLTDKDCIDCHASRFNGDADKIYLR